MNFSPRSEYFKTELTTFVGSNSKSKEVKEYSYDVLNTAIDFMYGIEIPDTFYKADDLRSLLHLADFYMMEDLKGAASFLIAEGLNTENVFDISHLAEGYRAEALADRCVQFLFDNASSIEDEKLVQLKEGTVLVSLVKKFVSESKKGHSWMTKIFGEKPDFDFKTRKDFGSYDDYEGYMMATVKPGMFVQHSHGALQGVIRIVKQLSNKDVYVGNDGEPYWVPVKYLEILTPPVKF